MNPLHIVLLSGGKDSAAVATLALQRVPREQIRLIFVDTGNENPQTYAYLEAFEAHFGLPVERLKADFSDRIAARRKAVATDSRTGRDKRGRRLRWSNKRKREALSVLHPTGNPFLDLCLLNGSFPTHFTRFCTRELKVNLVNESLLDLHESGTPLVVWQGVKRADSQQRQHLRRFARQAPGWWLFRPLIDWTDEQVFSFLRASGTPINPVYGSGFSRVSCFPCLYARKSEIAQIADTRPDQIDRIRQWEHLVSKASKTGFESFFLHQASIPGGPETWRERRSIDGIVKWSRVDFRKNKKARIEDVFPSICEAGQGMCE